MDYFLLLAPFLVLISAKIFPVFHGRISLVFLEQFTEMAVIFISHPLCNFHHAHLRVSHQNFRLFQPCFHEIIDEIHPDIRLELLAQITGIVMILIGIVMTVAGIASGGATDGLKKVDERYDFISLGYDHLNQETYNLSDIKSIDINYAYCYIRFVEGDS